MASQYFFFYSFNSNIFFSCNIWKIRFLGCLDFSCKETTPYQTVFIAIKGDKLLSEGALHKCGRSVKWLASRWVYAPLMQRAQSGAFHKHNQWNVRLWRKRKMNAQQVDRVEKSLACKDLNILKSNQRKGAILAWNFDIKSESELHNHRNSDQELWN